jgi:hypothetical protein
MLHRPVAIHENVSVPFSALDANSRLSSCNCLNIQDTATHSLCYFSFMLLKEIEPKHEVNIHLQKLIYSKWITELEWLNRNTFFCSNHKSKIIELKIQAK